MQILEETEMDYSEKWGVDVEEAVKLAPVSYTHLDVYKRQTVHSESSVRLPSII